MNLDLPDFDSIWNYDRPEATEEEFRKILSSARSRGNRDYLAQLLTQIARAQGLQMDFEKATGTLAEAESLIGDDMPVARVRLLLERGRIMNSLKRPEESRPHFETAWELAQRAGADGFAVDAAHMLGIVEPGDASMVWNRRAIALAERSTDPRARRWLGSLYNNMGWTHHGAGDYETALEFFRRALASREAEGKKHLIRIAHWCIARTLRSLGRTEEALKVQRSLFAEGKAEGHEDGFVHEELGECLLTLERAEEAQPHFAAAHRLLSRDAWLRRDEPDRLERLRRLGGVETPAGSPAE